jgi:glycosyltransferase involved in cell wall biosynthesis
MKVALVHDYLNEFGGAERVLETLAEMYPEAPIYTAFYTKGSTAYERFKGREIRPSWGQYIPGFTKKLHSPLRFLAPLIWESFNFDEYEVVISSASWYITKGIITRPETIHICYCHTPPRFLYGYETSINWRKFWPVRLYAGIVNKFLRQYDFLAAQRVDYFVANSKNVQARIAKFYRRESEVIYPPVELKKSSVKALKRLSAGDYYLVISRLVGGKGLLIAVEAANKLKLNLKVVGAGAGWSREEEELKRLGGETVEFLGYVPDEQLGQLYSGAKAFLALAKDEDFGITPVEAQMCGTPVIAYNGGGYKETVNDKTGILFDEYSTEGLIKAIKNFEIRAKSFDERLIRKQAEKFGKERFVSQMRALVEEKWGEKQRELRFKI